MKLFLSSSGKPAVLSGKVGADLFIDCRGMINPHRDPVLGGLTGDSKVLQDWIEQKNPDYVNAVLNMILVAINTAPTRSGGAGKVDLRVHFFCMAGVHRSRGMKHVMAKLLPDHTSNVEIEVIL